MIKKTFLVASVIFCRSIIYCHAQNTDTVQPDSLYRKYNIHLRRSIYQGALTKAQEIFIFDRDGRYSGFKLTDNETGTVPQLTETFSYNSKGILSAESDTLFKAAQYAVKKADLFYDSKGRLIKEILKNDENIVSEKNYSPDENSETEKLYRNGKVYRQHTSYYDNHHKKIRFTGTEPIDKDEKPKVIELNGKKYTFSRKAEDQNWDYIFENTYDKSGNLITQKRFVNGVFKDETNFIYDERGLLIEEIESAHKGSITFEYVYY